MRSVLAAGRASERALCSRAALAGRVGAVRCKQTFFRQFRKGTVAYLCADNLLPPSPTRQHHSCFADSSLELMPASHTCAMSIPKRTQRPRRKHRSADRVRHPSVHGARDDGQPLARLDRTIRNVAVEKPTYDLARRQVFDDDRHLGRCRWIGKGADNTEMSVVVAWQARRVRELKNSDAAGKIREAMSCSRCVFDEVEERMRAVEQASETSA